MFFNENAVKNKIQTYKESFWTFLDKLAQTREEKMRQERRLDQELKDTFPASDPITHSSRKPKDSHLHH